ncbi:tRNA glutamyl-Q(34) synthetase GluQRS [Vibrio sp. 10N.286.49.B3]|uniref:tRNA glutamyl-Q(34) synthetase GluQRS n=1 Tax=Vibrio sp. 10N.286.49.B3 TaxID=1880855 RepID=UPI000C85D206|nr:tRNA glutamyl-Q(34) synthetase GluQRS [Vibrio sp. 10N.286.49.B3]PMH41250.1 tRNA glutamyl-Q(34) synthetase GluQRS [Vibrio sp. 10N.286.49.B3]
MNNENATTFNRTSPYVGRFAPSPSGPLHFGSLVAALGSYFQARSNNGQWLVRMEDLDPPREMPGAADLILKTLESYHLYWDSNIVYQSQRHDFYQAQIDQWLLENKAYYCQCTRKQIKEQGGYYPGTCRNAAINTPENSAVRVVMNHPVETFIDQKHGDVIIPKALAREDFIIKRRDGLFAYNLAVVLDDIDQKVTEVVRGADLIEPTGRQISLYHNLNVTPVDYVHLPLALDVYGQKLSKQNHATAIDLQDPKPTLLQAMHFLGFNIHRDMNDLTIDEVIKWGCQNWHLSLLTTENKITPRFSNASL